jgi:hypothetical protein
MTVAEYDELLPPRVVDPVRRRRWQLGALAVAVVAAAVGGGVWWHQTAGARAQHRYAKALPAAEAAWGPAKAKIRALSPPAGWTVDPTDTACGSLTGGVTCWRATSSNAGQTLSTAVAVLEAHGARVGNRLTDLWQKANGLSSAADSGCTSVGDPTSAQQIACPVYLTWDGASVQVLVVPGLADYDVPAGIAIARGPAYPESQNAVPVNHSTSVGGNLQAVHALTGLPASQLAGLTCRLPAAGGGCLSWSGTFTDPRPPAEVLRDDVRLVTAARFRPSQAGQLGQVAGNLTGSMWRYRSPDGADPALVLVAVHPDGSGTRGRLSIGDGGLPE